MNNTETKSVENKFSTEYALSGMTIPELAALLEKLSPDQKQPPYRTKQIFSWIYRGALSFDNMTSLPKDLKKTLEDHTVIRGSRIQKKLADKDGTVKFVFELRDGALVEAVLLEAEKDKLPATEKFSKARQFTACLSTQAGCPMGCVFCKTGSLGFYRNLETSEIVEQFLFLSDHVKQISAHGKQTSAPEKESRLSHIVVMGMGEPMFNLPVLRKALSIICDPEGFGISKRKITVSTAGVSEGILDMAENGPEAELALSLASAREDLRRRLMPGTVKYPLAGVKNALRKYQKKQKRRITIETVLLSGINTGQEDARALIDFTAGLDAAVNLIPWNPVKDAYFEGKKIQQSGQKEIEQFIRMLEQGGLTVTQRYRRGRGVSGACGQLGEIQFR